MGKILLFHVLGAALVLLFILLVWMILRAVLYYPALWLLKFNNKCMRNYHYPHKYGQKAHTISELSLSFKEAELVFLAELVCLPYCWKYRGNPQTFSISNKDLTYMNVHILRNYFSIEGGKWLKVNDLNIVKQSRLYSIEKENLADLFI